MTIPFRDDFWGDISMNELFPSLMGGVYSDRLHLFLALQGVRNITVEVFSSKAKIKILL
jgi:hypothetical protein